MEQFFETARPLVTYIGPLVLFVLGALWALDQHNSRFESKLAAVSALVALALLLNLNSYVILDYAVSLGLVAITALVIVQLMRKHPSYGQNWRQNWLIWLVILLGGLASLWLFGHYYQQDIRNVTIKVMLSTEPAPETLDQRRSADWEQRTAERFGQKTGAQVMIIPAPANATQRLEAYLKQFDAPQQTDHWRTNPTNDVDVFTIDLAWTGIMQQYAADLTSALQEVQKQFIPAITVNNTINGKLVAIPWHIDIGLLYYRKDLLKKYDIPEPPKTWSDLETAARVIQQGERETNPYFWGFIWQGKAYEGLTCNALEWQASNGNPTIINSKGEVNLNNLQTIAAFERARTWIGDISPPDATSFDEGKTFDTWMEGNAAFMRNWPYAYRASQEASWAAEGDRVGVALLPQGDGMNARHAATLGGWQLIINAETRHKQKKAAIEFVRFLTQKETQRDLAIATGKLPVWNALYEDPTMLRELNFPKNLDLRESITNAVTRISPQIVESYPAISKAYFEEVHKLLKGEKPAEAAVRDIEIKLQQELSR